MYLGNTTHVRKHLARSVSTAAAPMLTNPGHPHPDTACAVLPPQEVMLSQLQALRPEQPSPEHQHHQDRPQQQHHRPDPHAHNGTATHVASPTGPGQTTGTAASPEGAVVTMPSGLQLPASCFRPFVQVVLDHAGFAQTVENVHALGHLKKDGWVAVRITEAHGMTVAALTKKEHIDLKRNAQRGTVASAGGAKAGAGAGAAGGVGAGPGGGRQGEAALVGNTAANQRQVHMIIPLDVADWKKMCRVVPRERCLMPSRVYVQGEEPELVAAGVGPAAAGSAGAEAGGARAQAGAGAGAGPSGLFGPGGRMYGR